MVRRLTGWAWALVLAAGCACGDEPGPAPIGPPGGGDDGGPDGPADAPTGDACLGDCVRSVSFPTDWLPGGAGTRSEGVEEEPGAGGANPWLTLGDSGSVSPKAESVWVSNSGDGTVSRLSAATGKESARYVSVVSYDVTFRPHGEQNLPMWNEPCTAPFLLPVAGTGNCPSRTAVDQNFDAYVANRAFDGRASVTKYANALEDCVDRNNDQTIQTSSDKDGDGTIDLDQTGADDVREFYAEDDECILWTKRTGANSNAVARAIAVSKSAGGEGATVGDVWVGHHARQQMVRMDATTGALLDTLSVAPFAPYGAVAGPDSRVWFVFTPVANVAGTARDESKMVLGYVEREPDGDWTVGYAPEVDLDPAPGGLIPYGTVVDAAGRVWIANIGHEPGALYFDPATSTWGAVVLPPIRRYGAQGAEIGGECLKAGGEDYAVCQDGVTAPNEDEFPVAARGMGASYKSVWVAISFRCTEANNPISCLLAGPENLVARIDLAGGTPAFSKYLPMPDSRVPVGVGYSSNGRLWVVGQSSTDVSHVALDEDDELDGTWQRQVVGNGPYTYSDFIGFGLNQLANPGGYYSAIIAGCPAGQVTTWKSVTFDAEEPAGTNITFNARTAAQEASLEDATWVSGFDGPSALSLEAAPGPLEGLRYLQLEMVLSTGDTSVRPRIRDVSVQFTCDIAVPN